MPVRGSSSTEQPRPSPTYLPSESTQEGEAFFFLRKENLATQTDRNAGPHKRLPQRNEKENGTWTLQNSRQEARSQAGDWAPSKGVRGQKPQSACLGRRGSASPQARKRHASRR